MTIPISIEELDQLCVHRPCHGTAHPKEYSDIGAKMPAVRGRVLHWFQEALTDEKKKWVAAALLTLKQVDVVRLIPDLLRAGMSEPNPSFNRAFVTPLARKANWATVAELMLSI